jgi:hypothetical protein
MQIVGFVGNREAKGTLRGEVRGQVRDVTAARDLGRQLADALLARGAAALLGH